MRLAVIAFVLLPACGSNGDPSTGTTPAPRPRSAATVRVALPESGSTVPAGAVHVRVDLQGGRIVPDTTTDLKPDEGHLHLKLDGTTVSMTYGLDQQIDVEAGTHLLEAEFVASDHAPFNPRVIDTVTFVAQ